MAKNKIVYADEATHKKMKMWAAREGVTITKVMEHMAKVYETHTK